MKILLASSEKTKMIKKISVHWSDSELAKIFLKMMAE